jgi:outer membrane protein OmpA-like peptidoglycan-associated protein
MNNFTNILNINALRRWHIAALVGVTLVVLLTLTQCRSSEEPPQAAAHNADQPTRENTTKDVDGDGVLGKLDACPQQAGAAIDNGCPIDTDNDGFADLDDQCPTRAGDDNGCPQDIDSDGVPDAADDCPDLAGAETNRGCPSDADGDGVRDAEDQCPQTPGLVAENGCVATDAADDANTDNKTDQTASEQRRREPLVLNADDQQILDNARDGVSFDSSSANLTTSSQSLLNNVAALMGKYPSAILEIRGHTDASGGADANMQLSMDRARSTAAFLVSAGIPVERLRAFGYGESQPVASNDSVAGRQLNRRVEFDLLSQ